VAFFERTQTESLERDRSLAELEGEVTSCRACPRLVSWREHIADIKRAAYKDETYWGRPLAGFGDPAAGIYVLGLAPAAHGGNRTGRIFTGDRSGDWLFASLYRCGLSNQPTSIHTGDGLRLQNVFIAAAVRCVPPKNKPTAEERDNCLGYAARELELLPTRVIVCLGSFAWDAAARLCNLRPRPRFGHGELARTPSGQALLGCYHPSQQNTFTKKLTEEMTDAIFSQARELSELNRP
jgi:uracil-DNA glycosylase family 4